jgi:cyclic beta-1,2-glucan synthetase
MLAVMVRPHDAVANFAALAAEGAEGPFGFYEAIDYTPQRVPAGQRSVIVRSYMSHHQGMSFLALANVLFGEPFPRRLSAEAMVRATELLLQERVPWEAPLIQLDEDTAAAVPSPHAAEAPVSRRITTPDTLLPRTELISNSEYTVLLTNAGSGRSTFRDLDVTRWREDRTCDPDGQVVYVRDPCTGEVWAAGYQPVCRRADSYEAVFAIDKADIRRRDGTLETVLEVTVSTEHPAEVRRVTITNHGDTARTIELTSYVELALLPHGADLAHPAFGKLFLETEHLPRPGAVLCRRRPRSDEEDPLWAVHVAAVDGPLAGEPEFDTDRATFIGRGRTLARPAALDPGARLAGNAGAVLDPIFCLRRVVRVPAGASASVTFTTAIAESRDEALTLADRYRHTQAVIRAFELAWANGPVELKHLNITASEAHLFQRLAGHLIFASPALRAPAGVLRANRLGQEALWRHGISGDRPILLVTVSSPDDLGLVRQLLLAHTYLRHNGLAVDLVILNERPSSYFDELVQQLQQAVRSGPARDLIDRPGGVFLRQADAMSEDDRVLLLTAARVLLTGSGGGLEAQVERHDAPPELPPDWVPVATGASANGHPRPAPKAEPRLLFDNGYGGFTPDGREYVISVAGNADCRGRMTPAPWVNVLANPTFGCIASESSLGSTWAGNSQANRLTPWSNDPVTDPPGELVYLRDETTGEVWTPTARPLCRDAAVRVRHGQGYTVYEQTFHDLAHELTVFVPTDDAVKLVCLKLVNHGGRRRYLSATYYAEWVLGGTREQSAPFVVTEVDATSGALFARNPYRTDFADRVAFADVLQRPRTVTADRTEFLGRNRSPANAAALERQHLSGRAGAGLDPCAALQVHFEIDAGAEWDVVFILGEAADPVAARMLLQRYREPGRVHDALAAVRRFWDEVLGAVQVETPEPALDLLLNRWLLYQVLACRMWGRMAFYQSSGAFGFRDQLQDCLALVYATPSLTREHLLRAAGRQFAEGDVQHWWHPPGGGGVRTRCSDDRLWLPFTALHYVAVTGDAAVFDERVPFLVAPPLRPGQDDSYSRPATGESASVYEHCARAIDVSLTAGPHGLPLIGSCDWNDGFNRVGNSGRGESVWLAWFMLTILPEFVQLAECRGDHGRVKVYTEYADRLHKTVEDAGWDGGWYRRAYFDNGTPLGTQAAFECRIDSLPQSWAVISGQADQKRAGQALDSVEEVLVRQEERLIRLYTRPFDHSEPNPGYIAGYLPGVRENGGQYTHASTWVVLAAALLGRTDRAMELLNLLNPIVSANAPGGVARYVVEPYVLAGDVYDNPAHRGRGGWTWYTGSAAWFYRVALETLLGIELRGSRIMIRPRVPRAWPGYVVRLRYRTATYTLRVEGAGGPGAAVREVWRDGQRIAGVEISLQDDGRAHDVRVVLG